MAYRNRGLNICVSTQVNFQDLDDNEYIVIGYFVLFAFHCLCGTSCYRIQLQPPPNQDPATVRLVSKQPVHASDQEWDGGFTNLAVRSLCI